MDGFFHHHKGHFFGSSNAFLDPFKVTATWIEKEIQKIAACTNKKVVKSIGMLFPSFLTETFFGILDIF